MKRIQNHTKKAFYLLLVAACLSQLVMAIDGIVLKSKSSKSTFSNMKKNLTLTLHNGFSFSDNKTFGFKKNEKHHNFKTIISYQKGNIKYNIPYKNKAILQKFKTPQKQ